jgi:hypothetical protein
MKWQRKASYYNIFCSLGESEGVVYDEIDFTYIGSNVADESKGVRRVRVPYGS